MQPDEFLKPIGVFLIIVAVILAGTAVVAFSGTAGPADGRSIEGQSPAQFQPDDVVMDADPETGEIEFEGTGEAKRILIDTQHANRLDREKIQPLVEALIRRGHTVRFSGDLSESSVGTDEDTFNATLRRFDAVLIPFPVGSYDEEAINGLRAFADAGGRIVVLGGPTEYEVSTSLFAASIQPVRFGATGLVSEFGMRMGSDLLYNVEDTANDNNYKSIYAEPIGDGRLVEGVETVNFDAAGYILIPEGSDATPLMRAVDGTKRFSTRRGGEYVTAARNGNFVLVGDETFIEDTDVYDVDNERFVSNLLRFLVSGDKPENAP